jgi:hypothetical protein
VLAVLAVQEGLQVIPEGLVAPETVVMQAQQARQALVVRVVRVVLAITVLAETSGLTALRQWVLLAQQDLPKHLQPLLILYPAGVDLAVEAEMGVMAVLFCIPLTFQVQRLFLTPLPGEVVLQEFQVMPEIRETRVLLETPVLKVQQARREPDEH